MAATSKCPKCDGISFELVNANIARAGHPLRFVRCASCGVVVGVVDSYNISALIIELARRLNIPNFP
jgi:uncharacterized Zn finger protein